VVTVPDHKASLDVVRQVRSLAPHVKVFARARLGHFVAELERAGASEPVNEEFLTGQELGRRVRESLI